MYNITPKKYPYGFNSWMNKLWQYGKEKGIWNYSVTEYKDKLDHDAWLFWFMQGLSWIEAIEMDLREQ